MKETGNVGGLSSERPGHPRVRRIGPTGWQSFLNYGREFSGPWLRHRSAPKAATPGILPNWPGNDLSCPWLFPPRRFGVEQPKVRKLGDRRDPERVSGSLTSPEQRPPSG